MTKRLTSIVYLRAIAAILIFACHTAYIAGSFVINTWLNTGVPVFFIISAYLLALKPNTSEGAEMLKFYRRRAESIFPSYWIYLICAIVILILIGQGPDLYSIASFSTGMHGFAGGKVLGLGHLWFISVLIACYVITPSLNKLCISTHGCPFAFLLTVILVAQTFLFLLIGKPAYCIHVGSYICVYCYYNKNRGVVSVKQFYLWATLAIITSVIRISYDAAINAGDIMVNFYYDKLFHTFARLSCAMALFTIFIYYSEKIEHFSLKNPRTHRVINGFSGISYEFYLAHQFILLSFYQFVPAFHSGKGLVVWIVVSFVATVANALVLVYVNNKVTNKSNKSHNQNGKCNRTGLYRSADSTDA